ncbi:MAG: hypothetical protein K2K68_03910 [Duncaniella sp.]|nr:hypothetical protein [Duncaniella sp.]
MPPKNISSYSERAVALIVLSKLLYGMASMSGDSAELRTVHHKLLIESVSTLKPDSALELSSIPWDRLFDSIVESIPYTITQRKSGWFTVNELRYMAAMLCGLSGKEFGLITGYRSHYNLSWNIRQKLNLTSSDTNLRQLLRKLSKNAPI